MSDANSHSNEAFNPLLGTEISSLYIEWNLPESTRDKLDTWELWQPTKQELSRAIYKVKKTASPVREHYERHLLYKGNLYHLVWQNDSAEHFFTPRGKDTERFIISVRAIGSIKVALVQRRWKM